MKSVRLIKITVGLWRNAIKNNPYNSECCDVNGLILSRKRAKQYDNSIWGCVQQRIYQSQWTMWFMWSSIWSQFGLACSRLLSMRQLMNKKGVSACKWIPVWGFVIMCEIAHFLFIFYSWIAELFVWQCVSLNYYGPLANALVVSG